MTNLNLNAPQQTELNLEEEMLTGRLESDPIGARRGSASRQAKPPQSCVADETGSERKEAVPPDEGRAVPGGTNKIDQGLGTDVTDDNETRNGGGDGESEENANGRLASENLPALSVNEALSEFRALFPKKRKKSEPLVVYTSAEMLAAILELKVGKCGSLKIKRTNAVGEFIRIIGWDFEPE